MRRRSWKHGRRSANNYLLKPLRPYQIREHSLIARLAALKLDVDRVAIVIGHTIHLYHATEKEFRANETWFRHELCHVRQFEQHGFFPFIIKYLWESVRKGYRNNRFEVEAREAERGEGC